MFNKNLLLLLCGIFLISGCINEKSTDCIFLSRVKFLHTLNETGKDEAAEHLRDLRMYVFDRATGVLVDIIRIGSKDIAKGFADVKLPDGEYTLVAWAGGGADLLKGGFKDAQASGSDPAAYPEAVIGTTTLNDFRMMLASMPYTGAGPGEVVSQVKQFDDLFYATAGNVVVRNGRSERDIELNFVKNSALLNVVVKGVQHLSRAASLPDVFVVGRNGSILYDNEIDPNAQNMRYEPYGLTSDAGTMNVRIKTLKLDIDKETEQPVLLYVRNSADGSDIMSPPLNVVSAIRNIKDAAGNSVYKTQEDIDREDEFRIDITLARNGDTSLSVSVTINGFEIVQLTPVQPEV